MNRPLFVHSNVKTLVRITRESNSFAMVTASMAQALQWIINPEVRLSGLFLNPDDTSFSAFRFMELVLQHRPALPVFLFESHLGASPEAAQKLINSTHIKGVFLGTEPFSQLVAGLKILETPETAEQDTAEQDTVIRTPAPERSQHPGYVAVPITDFFSGSRYPYTVFLFNEDGKAMLFSEAEAPIDPVYLFRLAKNTHFLYIRESDIQKHKTRLQEAHAHFMDDDDFPMTWKTAEMMVTAKNLLNEMKESGLNEQLVEYTQDMLKDLFNLISKINPNDGSLYPMIDRAKKCDRAVFCASWSMLICKQLHYEKTATLEILGLSSILQDIALYHTPCGDLSEKLPGDLSPEETKHYLQHPTLSADLVAQNSTMPEVTLQVIRQQHERKDKTGFPHRVGGTQLHPMSEILSVINSYYEISKKQLDDTLVIQELQRTVFPHYSEAITTAFKKVLGSVLKDKPIAVLES